ncbi:MAG TPA: ATP-binding protein [Gemmatimonadaceae bacterium]|nr:ATP-binding protein [Gemmatimonadaceae bacterium]
MYPRYLADSLTAALADTPVVLLVGPRQVGKSTLARTVASQAVPDNLNDRSPARYITFDDVDVLTAARQDSIAFIANLEGPVVLDEIQRAPELFLPIKAAVDRDRRPGRFLLTGSADVLTLPTVADSLAGRMEIVHLWPLSQGEIAGAREHFLETVFAPTLKLPGDGDRAHQQVDRQTLIQAVVRGGYPEAVARPSAARRRAFFQSYVSTLLNRDVRDLSGISDVSRLNQLLTAVAGRVGGLTKGEDLSRTLAIPATTLRRYLDLFEMMFLVTPLPAWSLNMGTRVIKSPKLYLSDTGLLANQLGATVDRIARDPSIFGPLLENFVVNELRKQASWSVDAPTLYHYRAQSGHEVDIVLEAPDGRLVGIEVKATATPGPREFAGLRHLAERVGTRFVRGIVLYGGTDWLPFGPDLYAVPIGALWTP